MAIVATIALGKLFWPLSAPGLRLTCQSFWPSVFWRPVSLYQRLPKTSPLDFIRACLISYGLGAGFVKISRKRFKEDSFGEGSDIEGNEYSGALPISLTKNAALKNTSFPFSIPFFFLLRKPLLTFPVLHWLVIYNCVFACNISHLIPRGAYSLLYHRIIGSCDEHCRITHPNIVFGKNCNGIFVPHFHHVARCADHLSCLPRVVERKWSFWVFFGFGSGWTILWVWISMMLSRVDRTKISWGVFSPRFPWLQGWLDSKYLTVSLQVTMSLVCFVAPILQCRPDNTTS